MRSFIQMKKKTLEKSVQMNNHVWFCFATLNESTGVKENPLNFSVLFCLFFSTFFLFSVLRKLIGQIFDEMVDVIEL